MGNELPYMPTFIGDFMTAVAIWPPDRVGAYWLALMFSWEHDGVPADEANELAGVLHLRSRSAAVRLWGEIAHKFRRGPDGRYRNLKQEAVRVEATRQHIAAKSRAKSGAAARWGKGANGNAQGLRTQSSGNPQAHAQAMPEQSLSNANQSHSKKEPPQPPAGAGGSRRRRRSAHGPSDAEVEQLRKTALVKQFMGEGLSFADASRKAGFS